ncbi:MAG: hypothetical protein EX272_00995 [Chromatiales bacterium]|nr:MAG: hypothetical protein EX272_00995 [Chromatiales bacterium]
MNRLIKTTAAVALLFAAQSALACDYPQRVSVPDGATASKEDMIAGQRGVKSYMASMEEYLSCIEADEAQRVLGLGDVDDKTKRQQEETFNKKYNAAVEEMNLVAEEFNMQVRAYKDRNR